MLSLNRIKCICTLLLLVTSLLVQKNIATAGVVTNLILKEMDGVTTTNYPLTFGHVFKKGDVHNSVQMSLNGQQLQTQFDIKRHWDDGSVKHGVISVIIPKITANQTYTLLIETGDDTNNYGALKLSEIQAINAESQISLTGLTGSGYSGNLTASLRDSLNNASNLEYWLQGPICTEVIVKQKLNNSLNTEWEARYYPTTTFGVRISNAMENVEANYRGNINYAVNIVTGTNSLSSVYSKPSFQHNESSRWRKVLWIGNAPPEVEIHFNLPYFISTGSIMNYDTNLKVPESIIANEYSRWKQTNHDIMGNGIVNFYFPQTGGRQEIGILPTWTARYLLTMDNRMREIMLNSAEMVSGCEIHYRESDSAMSFYGLPISIDDRPGVRTTAYYASNSTYRPGTLPSAIGATSTPWTVDRAHQGSFAYIPYLITGEKYFLTEMYYWACWNLSQSAFDSNWGRDYSAGIIRDQVRGEAWAIRNIADAAAFTPDSSPLKNYLIEKVNNNITTWMTEKNRYPLNYWGIDTGAATEGMVSTVQDVTSPWMEDFMLLSLAHLQELGFQTKQIIDWYGSFAINRFHNPDFNWYNGPAYRFPAKYTNGSYPKTWAEANAAFSSQPNSFVTDDYPYSYRFISLAALSCLTNYPNGQEAYDWLKSKVNNQETLNDDPTWAIIKLNPRPYILYMTTQPSPTP